MSLFVRSPEIEDRDEVETVPCSFVTILPVFEGSVILVKSTKV
jgi:hypothetical protein